MDLRGPQKPSPTGAPATVISPGVVPSANLPPAPDLIPTRRFVTRRTLTILGIGVGLVVILAFVGVLVVSRLSRSGAIKAGNFANQKLSLAQLSSGGADASSSQALTVNGRLNVSRSVVFAPSVQPAQPVAGQLYYDQNTKNLAFYNGDATIQLAGGSVVQNTTNLTTINNNTSGGTTTGTPNAIISNASIGSLVKLTSPTTVSNSLASESQTTLSVAGNLNLSSEGQPGAELTGFRSADAPIAADNPDTQAVELGVKFRTDVSGFVRGVRFYKGATGTGAHTGSLWTSSGTQLATVTFTSETASGWQEARFSTPIAISSDTVYVVSYHGVGTSYAATADYFATSGQDNGVLHLLQNGDDGANGVFKYSATSTMPNKGFVSTNYWADVVFAPNPTPNHYQVNGVQVSSSDLSNNPNIAKRGSSQTFTGSNTFRNSVDSTTTFTIQAATGLTLFSVDATDNALIVGPAGGTSDGTLLVLGKRNVDGDPAGIEGAMYFNAATRSFRCFRYNQWDNCAQLEADHAFTNYDEFMGGQTTSLAGAIGELGWNAQAIGANGSLSFNPVTPAPSVDRPGVLQLTTPAVANQGTTLMLGSPTAGSMLPSSGLTIKTGVAVGATTGQVIRVGLDTQTTGTAQPVSGLWWQADSSIDPNWQFCYGNGTQAICSGSNVAVVANTWVSLQARINSMDATAGTASLTFIINNQFNERPSVTFDTATRLSPAYSCFSTTAAAHTCDWDYFQLKGTTTATR